jgi:hypothetical protein
VKLKKWFELKKKLKNMGYRAVPNKSDRYKQGKYNLIHPSKYLGSPSDIWYRSSWEYKLYFYLDNDPRVLHWNVEGITIPYEIQIDGKWQTCRYHPDAYCEIQKLDGTVSKTAIEIKPYAETIPPEQPKKDTLKSLENYEYRMKLFLRNLAKWKTAKEFCNKRGIDFFVMTEKWFDGHSVKLF